MSASIDGEQQNCLPLGRFTYISKIPANLDNWIVGGFDYSGEKFRKANRMNAGTATARGYNLVRCR